MRPRVRSMNWSGKTMSSGLYSCLRLPTALAERMYSTPSIFIPKMLARKFSSDGESRCPAPCRARNATRFPRSVPIRYGPEGSPNGVVSATSLRSVTSAMSYRPLPPMIPIWTCSMCRCGAPSGLSPNSTNYPPPTTNRLQHLLHEPASVPVADVSGSDARIVLEENQVLALDRLSDEVPLERHRLHGEQVVSHDPGVLQVRRRRDQIRDEHGGLPARLDEDDLVLAGVAAGANHTDAGTYGFVPGEERHDAGVLQRHEIVLQVAGAVSIVWMRCVLPLGRANQISGVGKTRSHAVAVADRGAAEMVPMKVGRQRQVDRRTRQAGLRQCVVQRTRPIQRVDVPIFRA